MILFTFFLSVRIRLSSYSLEIVVVYPNFIGKTYSNLFCLLKCVLFLSVRFYSFYFFIRFSMNIFFPKILSSVVGSSGLEPPTSRLSGARSNHLSYEPISYFDVSRLSRLFLFTDFHRLVEMMGFEPMTPCLQGRCSPN